MKTYVIAIIFTMCIGCDAPANLDNNSIVDEVVLATMDYLLHSDRAFGVVSNEDYSLNVKAKYIIPFGPDDCQTASSMKIKQDHPNYIEYKDLWLELGQDTTAFLSTGWITDVIKMYEVNVCLIGEGEFYRNYRREDEIAIPDGQEISIS